MTAQRIIIIGGVAGGMSAATRLRRLSEDADIVVLERGGHVSFANCGLPYYVGGEITDPAKLLVQTPADASADEVPSGDLETARLYGARVAAVTARLA